MELHTITRMDCRRSQNTEIGTTEIRDRKMEKYHQFRVPA